MKKKNKTYSEAMAELQTLMTQIESGNLEIDHLMDKVKLAAELIKFCKEQLTVTNDEVQKIIDNLEN